MASKHEQSQEHKKAHDLAEQAIEKAAGGDLKGAKKLADQAREIDPKIDDEMAREVESDRRKAENFKGQADKDS